MIYLTFTPFNTIKKYKKSSFWKDTNICPDILPYFDNKICNKNIYPILFITFIILIRYPNNMCTYTAINDIKEVTNLKIK